MNCDVVVDSASDDTPKNLNTLRTIIDSVKTDFCKGNRTVLSLKKDDCRRTSIDEVAEALKDLPNLKVFQLQDVALFPSRSALAQTLRSDSLRQLSLSGRGIWQKAVISALGDGSFLPCLTDLSLTGIALELIPAGFTSLTALETLDLCDNCIKSFDSEYDSLLSDCCWQNLKVFVPVN